LRKETRAAIKAAGEAGKIIMKHFKRKPSFMHKSSAVDLVTEADLEAEKKVKSILGKAFPDFGFLGEESGAEEGSNGRYWVVDPVDGTNNFAHRFPFFCVSIALVEEKKVGLGVIFDPAAKELFVAEKGKGAFLNGNRIRVSSTSRLIDSLVVTGFPYNERKLIDKTIKSISNLVGKTHGVRRMGSAALDLCYVASGRSDAFFEYELKPWDVAAGLIILGEAGGKLTTINNEKADLFSVNFIASNGKIHRELFEKLVRL